MAHEGGGIAHSEQVIFYLRGQFSVSVGRDAVTRYSAKHNVQRSRALHSLINYRHISSLFSDSSWYPDIFPIFSSFARLDVFDSRQGYNGGKADKFREKTPSCAGDCKTFTRTASVHIDCINKRFLGPGLGSSRQLRMAYSVEICHLGKCAWA